MNCRPGCGACCIAPSISSSILGMPLGKLAGVPCIHLLDDFRCSIFDSEERPNVCKAFNAETSICGDSREQAMANLTHLEVITVST